jgi:hypothetical protein
VVIDVEAIYAELANRMDQVRWTRAGEAMNAGRFITTDRRVKLFGEVAANQQPACFQAEHGETEVPKTNQPSKVTLEANWIIYQCIGKDKKKKGAIENNLILGGVRRALKPIPADVGFSEGRCTLGNLVHNCWIEGRIFKDPGDIDDQGMLVIPIKLLVP